MRRCFLHHVVDLPDDLVRRLDGLGIRVAVQPGQDEGVHVEVAGHGLVLGAQVRVAVHIVLRRVLALVEVQRRHVQLASARLGPVDGEDVAKVARDRPPHLAFVHDLFLRPHLHRGQLLHRLVVVAEALGDLVVERVDQVLQGAGEGLRQEVVLAGVAVDVHAVGDDGGVVGGGGVDGVLAEGGGVVHLPAAQHGGVVHLLVVDGHHAVGGRVVGDLVLLVVPLVMVVRAGGRAVHHAVVAVVVQRAVGVAHVVVVQVREDAADAPLDRGRLVELGPVLGLLELGERGLELELAHCHLVGQPVGHQPQPRVPHAVAAAAA